MTLHDQKPFKIVRVQHQRSQAQPHRHRRVTGWHDCRFGCRRGTGDGTLIAMPEADQGVELVDVVRSGFVESVHRGSVVALDPDGGVLLKAGAPDRPCFPRSANKPLQAVGMVRAGLQLDPPGLALAAASHSGEHAHVSRIRDLLTRNGLPESALLCPPPTES